MTPEQFAEMYAINMFNQDQAKALWANVADPPVKKCWHELTKKERNKWRNIADDLLAEIE